jgi:hypothetical protein
MIQRSTPKTAPAARTKGKGQRPLHANNVKSQRVNI